VSALKYWTWLTSRRGIGAAGAMTVLNHFATPELAYYADPEEYDYLPLDAGARASLRDKSMAPAEKILEDCERLSLRMMTIQDADYPERLRQLTDPPVLLYIRGKVFHFDEEVAIGVVGAREPSQYGRMAAEKFGFELVKGGALVVSGIAQGLDSCAIRGALRAGGPVVSVLAGGIDKPFPPESRWLHEDVAAAGALISEYPPGTPNRSGHFHPRNRIISGLCVGVLAVECRPYSGTMITVNHALDQDREVFAVPGAIDAPMSEGTNRLIQRGAKLVTCGQDILEDYWGRFPIKLAASAPPSPEAAQELLEAQEASAPGKPAAAREEERDGAPRRELVPREKQRERFTDDQLALLNALGEKSRTADELVELTQIPTKRVLSALTMLQVDAAVEESAGRRFSALVELEE